jgi:hypothetical protein
MTAPAASLGLVLPEQPQWRGQRSPRQPAARPWQEVGVQRRGVVTQRSRARGVHRGRKPMCGGYTSAPVLSKNQRQENHNE